MNPVVLLGAGHAHLYLAARAAAYRAAGTELLLVDPGKFWYSGLATGMLGGQLQPDADQVDAQALIQRAGGRFIQSRAVGLCPASRQIQLENGQTITYRLLSLNLGSEVHREIPGLEPHAWLVKPIEELARLRAALEERFQAGEVSVAVVGGGPTGCELAANVIGLARKMRAHVHLTLIHGGERLAPQFSQRASGSLLRTLHSAGIHVRLNVRVCEVLHDGVLLEGKVVIRTGFTIAATGLRAPRILSNFHLPLDTRGNLAVDANLQVYDHPGIFGAGDCINFDGRDLPKVGVFGVRQAPVLHHNLLSTLQGAPLKPYRPQKHYLLILNLGGKQGLAVRGGWHWHGRLPLHLKYWLDLRFLRQYTR